MTASERARQLAERVRRQWHAARDLATAVASLARYWLAIMPLVRRELRHWGWRAGEISDPALRRQALVTIEDERLNAEAAAVFATLVPRRLRAESVRLLVAFQVMYDYLDTVSEAAVEDPLLNGLQLHAALIAALTPRLPAEDWYLHHCGSGDGGYLDELVAACRASLVTLPAGAAVLPLARRAALRCGEGQSHTHSAMHDEPGRLVSWALGQDRAVGYLWWELAAGAISSVAVYALLAAAADPRTTRADAALVDAAYFPPICALSTLLDSFVDRHADVATGNFSYYAAYADCGVAAHRLASIAATADEALRKLRHARRHAAIVSGVAGYYLSSSTARDPDGALVVERLLVRLGSPAAILRSAMRLRRRLRAS